MPPIVRFAPSPTGYLHIGNMRTALINWLFARHEGGKFILRMDDTDKERSRPEFAAAIEEDMKWLGMEWDGFARQSDCLGLYEAAKQKLLSDGRLYPCYETQEELDIKRKMMASRGIPPVYDRAGLKLTEEQKKEFEAQGRKPHYRFKLEDKEVVWEDLVRGTCKYRAALISDPVLVRKDGVPLYTLASIVDDGQMKVTHVIRGEDHVTNTAVQIQIFEALGYTAPQFAHLALLRTKEGELSKRVGGNDIRGMRDAGIEAMAITAYLGRIGTSAPIEALTQVKPLIEGFDFNSFGRSPATFDMDELQRLSMRILGLLPFASVTPRLKTMNLAQVDEHFWNSVRGNLKRLEEIADWWNILHGNITPVIEDAELIAKARELLPPAPWNESSFKQWADAVSAATGKKGKALFHPLRLALTGRADGPEMKHLLPLLPQALVLQRLQG